MPVTTTRVTPIARDIRLAVSEATSPAARGKLVADFARATLADAERTNAQILGRVVPYEQFVDGRNSAPLESAQRHIRFEFDVVHDVVLFAFEELRRRSPVKSGRYKDSHRVFADGNEINLNGTMPAAEDYTITTDVRYARKVELPNKTALVIDGTDRPYQETAQVVRAKFRSVARIDFTYRSILGGERNPALTIRVL